MIGLGFSTELGCKFCIYIILFDRSICLRFISLNNKCFYKRLIWFRFFDKDRYKYGRDNGHFFYKYFIGIIKY